MIQTVKASLKCNSYGKKWSILAHYFQIIKKIFVKYYRNILRRCLQIQILKKIKFNIEKCFRIEWQNWCRQMGNENGLGKLTNMNLVWHEKPLSFCSFSTSAIHDFLCFGQVRKVILESHLKFITIFNLKTYHFIPKTHFIILSSSQSM